MSTKKPRGASEIQTDGSIIKIVKPRAAGSGYVSLPVDLIGMRVKISLVDDQFS